MGQAFGWLSSTLDSGGVSTKGRSYSGAVPESALSGRSAIRSASRWAWPRATTSMTRTVSRRSTSRVTSGSRVIIRSVRALVADHGDLVTGAVHHVQPRPADVGDTAAVRAGPRVEYGAGHIELGACRHRHGRPWRGQAERGADREPFRFTVRARSSISRRGAERQRAGLRAGARNGRRTKAMQRSGGASGSGTGSPVRGTSPTTSTRPPHSSVWGSSSFSSC